MVKSLLKMFGSMAVFALFYIYVYPFIFGKNIKIAMFITFTFVNICAIMLSWFYFDETGCYQDEGNPIAMLLYYLYGHSIGHIILIVSRAGLNLFFFMTLFGMDGELFGYPIYIAPEGYTLIAIPTALFTVEMLFNIYAIINHFDEVCGETTPAICEVLPDAPLEKCRAKKNRE